MKAAKRYLVGAATAFGLVAGLMGDVADAGTISIGWRQDGGAITTVAGSGVSDSFSAAGILTGNFTIASAGGLTQPTLPSPGLMFSNNTSVSAGLGGAAHTLDVFITAQGLTTPLGNPLGVISGLTENLLLGGFTTTLSTFLSATNALFGGTALSSQNFNAAPASTQLLGFANTGAGPYSVTAQYHIVSVAGQAGGADSTIAMVAVPGPVVGAGLPGLLAACFGLVALARRRRNTAIA
jgi:hypothetical protein